MSVSSLFAALAAYQSGVPVLVGAGHAWDAPAVLDAVESLVQRLASSHVLAVLADNSPAWAIADLAALKAGKIHLPLPAFFSAAQMAHALIETGADTVLTDRPERIEALDLGFVRTDSWNGLAFMQRKAPHVILPAGTAKVSFTSGSTGAPKGVCLSADGLIDTAAAVASRLHDLPIQRHLALLPLALLLENVAGIYAPLLRGAEVHLPGLADLGWRGMAGFDPAALQRSIGTAGANSVIMVPELLKAWVAFLLATQQKAPEHLVFVAVGGAHVDPGLLAHARALGIPAYQGYGLTECGSVVCLNLPGDSGKAVGRPLPHVAVRIDKGEVCVTSRAFLGYLHGEPAKKPATHGHEFATGDLGHLDADGHLHLEGRRKNLLITSFGRNIAPEWVEAALLAQPAIAQALVAGDARPALAAVLVPAPGAEEMELAAAVAQVNLALPDYARIAGWVTAAPFTPQNGQSTGNGRPIRTAILSQYAAALAALYPEEEAIHDFL
jgi:long-subunit acyl-CoA synthetase (AMP-forming)